MQSHLVEAFGRPLAQVIRDTPVPRGSEVLLRVGGCGVCHSDVHLQDGYFDLGGGNKLDLTRAMQLPRTLGHEIAGTVVTLGPEARGVQPGERRVVYPWIGCGMQRVPGRRRAAVRRPRALGVHRDGGFADHVIVPHARYLLDYGTLAEEQACTYACSGLTAYGALRKVGSLGAGDAVLVIGAGGVGLSGVRLAKHLLGVRPIVAEVDRSKWDIAREAGAADVIDPTAEGAQRDLLKATNGGVAAAVDFVGASASFAFGFGALRKGGRLITVGLMGGSASVTPVMLAMRAVSVIGSYVGTLDDLRQVLDIARSGTLPDLPLTMRPMAEADAAVDDLRAGRVRGRTILKN